MDFFSLIYYLNKFGVYVDYALFYQSMHNHPRVGTVHSFIDTLNKFEIKNYIVKIDFDQLDENPFPLIGFLNTGKESSELIIILKKKKKEVHYLLNNKLIKESKDSFADKWEGTAIYLEPNGKDSRYKLTVMQIIALAIIYLLLLVISIAFMSHPANLMLVFCLIGFLISMSLFKHDLGLSDIFANAVCKKNSIVDCDKVLDSNASTIFKVKMSDVGVVFFIVNIVLLLFSLISSSYNFVIFSGILSIMSLPYILFSLSYQFLYLKKICPLCISVMTVLTILSFISIYNVDIAKYVLSILDIFLFVTIVLLVILGYRYYVISLKSKIKQIKDSETLFTVKKDVELFNKIMNSQEIAFTSRENKSFYLGYRDNENCISIILSFNCPSCARIFEDLVTCLKRDPDSFGVHLYFIGLNDEKQEESRKLFIYLLNVYNEFGQSSFVDNLMDWYKNSHLEDSQIYKKINEIHMDDNKIREINDYIFDDVESFDYTPIVVVNNKIVPMYYSLADVKYFVNYSQTI